MPISLHDRALRHLAGREHSRAELARKLAPHGSAEEIDAELARLAELGLQSDARYGESYVRAKAARFGGLRLRQALRQRGLTPDQIDEALAAVPLEDERERARAIWQRKFGQPPADPREWARQARFLQARGFSPALIRSVLDEPAQ